jgi:hypothetical protein
MAEAGLVSVSDTSDHLVTDSLNINIEEVILDGNTLFEVKFSDSEK